MADRFNPTKRVCLRCQGLVPRRQFSTRQGVCHWCVREIGEFDLHDDPWAFAVDFDNEAVAA
jgi:hypothetical protein